MSTIAPNAAAEALAAAAKPAVGSPEHNAALAAMAPANVPDKFKNADGTVNVAALTEAYKSLETKQSTAKPPEATATAAPVANLDEAFKAAATAKPDAWKVAQAELANDGKISDVTRAAIKTAHNATDEMIDGMIAGHQAQRATVGMRLAEAAGGVEQMNAAIAYARTKLNDAQLVQLRQTLEGPNGELVMAGLVSKMGVTPVVAKAAEPSSINSPAGVPGSGQIVPFKSQAEMLAVFRDPRYHSDPAYQTWAGQRMAVTQGPGKKR